MAPGERFGPVREGTLRSLIAAAALSVTLFGVWALLDVLFGDGAVDGAQILHGLGSALVVTGVVVVLSLRRQRRRERRLEEAIGVLESLMRSTPEAIVTTDLRGGLTFVSDSACELLGEPAGELLGRRSAELYVRGQVEEVELGRALRDTGVVRDRAVTLKRADGGTVEVTLTVSVIQDAAGRPTGMLAMGRAAEKAEQELRVEIPSRAAIQELSASVAHEVRNPLAGIRGAMQVLCAQDGRPPHECAVMGEVLAQIRRLESMVQDLIDFAQPLSVLPVPVNVDGLAQRTIGLVRRQPSMAGVELGIEMDPTLEVLADEVLLRRALRIVLENAAHAVAGDGWIRLDASRDNGTVLLRIQDSGSGIDEAKREDVFRPFFTTKHKGSGLGLAIARRILEAHGGAITFECPSSGGTRFLLRLPAVPVRRGAPEGRERAPERALPAS